VAGFITGRGGGGTIVAVRLKRPELPAELPAELPRSRPWRAWALLAAGVLAVHALLLHPDAPGLAPPAASERRGAVAAWSVRTIAAAPAMATTAPPAARPAAPLPTPAAAPKGITLTPAPVAAAAERRGDRTPPDATPDAAADPPSAASALPQYATRLPPAVTLSYALQRGALSGSAVLRWQLHGDAYEATLAGRGPAAGPLFDLASRGGVDSAGVAPERFTDRRQRGGTQAANFRRDEARITYSGPAHDDPLPPGAQDRLSWLLQLAAIAEAEPQRLADDGAQVLLYVVGARGRAELWIFEVQPRVALDLPAGRVAAALHLKREPTRPYDQRVEVWLDPARHHLPVQLRLTGVPGREPTEMRLLAEGPL